MGVYQELGVKRIINAWGPMTIIGSARVGPEVVEAMARAAECYVDLLELQRAAGRRLADLIGVEACYISGGCAAGHLCGSLASKLMISSATWTRRILAVAGFISMEP